MTVSFFLLHSDPYSYGRNHIYLDDIFQATARTSQRPRWTFPERWLPVDTTLSPRPLVGRVPIRGLLLLLLLFLSNFQLFLIKLIKYHLFQLMIDL